MPEARTGRASLAEVHENAADALEEAILAYLAHGRPIPDPCEPHGGEEAIILDPVTAARVALATAMADEKDFQRRAREDAGESEGAIRRLTDALALRQTPKMKSTHDRSKHSGAGRAGFATSPDQCATMA